MSQSDAKNDKVRDLVRAAIKVDQFEQALDEAQTALREAERAVYQSDALPQNSLAVVTVDEVTYTVVRTAYREFAYGQAEVVI